MGDESGFSVILAGRGGGMGQEHVGKGHLPRLCAYCLHALYVQRRCQ